MITPEFLNHIDFLRNYPLGELTLLEEAEIHLLDSAEIGNTSHTINYVNRETANVVFEGFKDTDFEITQVGSSVKFTW